VASKIAKSVLIWTGGFLAITLALKLQPSISRVYVMLNGATVLLLLLAWRSRGRNAVSTVTSLLAVLFSRFLGGFLLCSLGGLIGKGTAGLDGGIHGGLAGSDFVGFGGNIPGGLLDDSIDVHVFHHREF
jgi:hypothetical protein